MTTLAEAVARIGRHEWPVQLTPTMQVLLGAVAELAGTEATPENAEELIEEFGSAARMLGAVIRHTTNPTMLEAGYKVNVVPGQATAQVDGRFLPGLEDDFLATLRELAGPDVDIECITKMPGLETPYDGEMADAMTASILEEDPDALVAPYLMSGGTDAKHFTQLGMRAFGFAPLRLPAELDFTALFHGVDERVPVDALEFGARVFDRFLGKISDVLDEERDPLADDPAAQLHPPGAVGREPHPVQLPATLLGPLDEHPGDGVARVLARDQHARRTRTPPRAQRARARARAAWPRSRTTSLVGGHVVEGRDDLGGQLALLDGERLAQLGGGAGAEDRRRDARGGRAPRRGRPRAGTSRDRRRPARRPRPCRCEDSSR